MLRAIERRAPVEEALTVLLHAVCGSDGDLGALVRLRDSRRQVFRIAAAHNLNDVWLDALGRRLSGVGDLLRGPEVIPNLARSEHLAAPMRALAESEGLKSRWLLPVTGADQQAIGSVVFYHRRRREPTQAQRRMLDFTARTVALVAGFSQSQDDLQESERRFRSIVEAASDWIWESDEKYRLTYVSAQAFEQLGYAAAEMLGRNAAEFVDWLDETDQQRQIERLHNRQSFERLTFRLKGSDGEVQEALISGRPIYGPDGEFRGYRGIGINISEAHQARQRAAAAERRFEDITANLPGIVLRGRLDGEGRISFPYVSAGVRYLLGLDPDRVHREPAVLLRAIDARDRRELITLIRESRRLQGSWSIEFRARHRDGSFRWLRGNGRPTVEADGVVAWDCIFLDVSEQKRMLLELQRAREAAERANLAKSQFLANVSHELRTPLNAIIGFSDIMHTEIFGPIGQPRYRDYVADIRHSGRHLLDLINDLLDVARLESGRMRLDESEAEPRALIVDALKLVQERADKAGISLEQVVEEPMPVLRVDRRKLLQVLVNLLANAIKFSETGQRVSVAAGPGENGGDYRFRVADRGIGMNEKDLQTVFEPFTQVDGDQTRQNEGAGLGLAISRALVELHGGSIGIRSALGEGTSVHVDLPAERVGEGGTG